MERLFGPPAAVLGRLRFARKFLLLGVVLVAPLVVVVVAYAREQTAAVSRTRGEQAGLKAMEPLLRLTQDLAAARHAAVTSGDAVMVPSVDLAGVDRTERRYAALLGTAGQWQEVRQQIALAGTTSGHTTALAAYDGAAVGLDGLIVAVSDASRLSVDPDLDASYLEAAVDVRVPALLDTATRIADQLTTDTREGVDNYARVELLSQVGVALGTIESMGAALDGAVVTAAQHSREPEVRTMVPAWLSRLDSAVSRLDLALRRVEVTRDTSSSAAAAAVAPSVAAAASGFTRASTDAVGRLLRARIAADAARARLVELIAAVTALVALYLFTGFYHCVARPIRRMVGALGAVAAGRFDEQVTITNRDELGYVAAAINDMIAKVRDATAQLAHEATHDPLTGLPNRSFISSELERSLPRAGRDDSLAVLFVDLDGFKLINDSLGHAAGDDVLREVARRLSGITRPMDTVARLSGDEFLLVCRGLDDVLDAVAVAERVLAGIAPAITVHTLEGEARQVSVGASTGIAYITEPTASAEDLIRDADVAMYRAKQLGRGRIALFDEGLRADVEERQRVREELHRAIGAGEFQVHYQPMVELGSGRIQGFEALVRWAHPERGLLPPGAFIAAAESSGLIVALGAHVLREACRQLALWRADPAMPDTLHVAVNLSTRQLADHDIVEVVRSAVAEARLDPSTLWLEITESALLTDSDTAQEVLLELRESGVRLVLDDFGTGYSSLQHLKIFPLDAIKIDRSFVSGLGSDDGDEAIVRSVVELARALGFTVVAEGVETAEQRRHLVEMGCGLAQGYLFARPAPAATFVGDGMAPIRATQSDAASIARSGPPTR